MTAFAAAATRSLWTNIVAFVDDLSARYREARRAQAERNRIFQELDSCTDRELAEMRISRGDIPAIANGTYLN